MQSRDTGSPVTDCEGVVRLRVCAVMQRAVVSLYFIFGA